MSMANVVLGVQPWEDTDWKYPDSLASPQQILTDASNGCSDYGNKFGEPVIAGEHVNKRGSICSAGAEHAIQNAWTLCHHPPPLRSRHAWGNVAWHAFRLCLTAAGHCCPFQADVQAAEGAVWSAGYLRTFGQRLANGERREWIKPIMFRCELRGLWWCTYI